MSKLSMVALASVLAAGFLANPVSAEAAAVPTQHQHATRTQVTHVQRVAHPSAPTECWKSTDPDHGAQRVDEGYMAPCQ
jgi:hypothetical protein